MKNLMTILMTSISEVLETMFFIPVEFRESLPSEEISAIRKGIKTGCELKVTGSFSGIFQLFIPNALLLSMTQNFMGEESENCTQEFQEGTLKEVLNMVVGNTLKKLETETPPELDIPRIIESASEDADSAVAVDTIEGTMIIQIKLN